MNFMEKERILKTLPSRPFVSIVMPALNEEQFIEAAINSILPKTGRIDYELLVVDGGSVDATRSVVQGIARNNPHIRLVDNEKRIQSVALNIAAKVADPRADFLVRADCHANYPNNFVERCVTTLKGKNVASVVVPMHTRGRNCMQRAIAAAQNSRLGNGGSAHRQKGRSGFVDHGHHAAFDRQVFLMLGGYDEGFRYNEDAEFDMRLTASGRRIYLDGEATIEYFPRADLISLARQYFNYGWGRANTLLKHRSVPKIRQVLPCLALVGCTAAALAAIYDLWALMVPAAYVFMCLAWGATLAIQERNLCLVLSGPAAIVMHFSWGAGLIKGLLQPSKWAWRPSLAQTGVKSAS